VLHRRDDARRLELVLSRLLIKRGCERRGESGVVHLVQSGVQEIGVGAVVRCDVDRLFALEVPRPVVHEARPEDVVLLVLDGALLPDEVGEGAVEALCEEAEPLGGDGAGPRLDSRDRRLRHAKRLGEELGGDPLFRAELSDRAADAAPELSDLNGLHGRSMPRIKMNVYGYIKDIDLKG